MTPADEIRGFLHFVCKVPEPEAPELGNLIECGGLMIEAIRNIKMPDPLRRAFEGRVNVLVVMVAANVFDAKIVRLMQQPAEVPPPWNK